MSRGIEKCRTRAVPLSGAFRVHKDPFELPPGPWTPGTGQSRYDDPDGQYGVRYLGGTIECCLKELFDRAARPSPSFEERAGRYGAGVSAAMTADDEEDVEDLDTYPMPPGADPTLDDVAGWLTRLNVASMTVVGPAQFPLVDHHEVLDHLDKHPRVRAVLDALQVQKMLGARLTQQVVRSTHWIAYRVTQAISGAVHAHAAGFGGVAYQSCVDTAEECWGVFGRTTVTPAGVQAPLLDAGPDVIAALRRAAAYVGVDLAALGL